MRKKYFLNLLQRYTESEASEKEIKELIRMVNSSEYDEWIKDHINGLLITEQMQGAKKDINMSKETAAEILNGILEKEPARIPGRILPLHQQAGKSYMALSNWKWVAAAVVMIISISWIYKDVFTVSQNSIETRNMTMQEVITKKGERTSLILGDGSRVTLNSDSRLQISHDYGRTDRTLILQGEAFFEVEGDPGLPFRVYTTGNVYTEVLGTQFNVRSYDSVQSGEGGITGVNVVVSQGRVRFGRLDENQSGSVVVEAGQMGEIDTNGDMDVSAVLDLDLYLGWVNGKLIFDDQPFEKVVTELERWYDIEISVTDPGLLERRLSAVFESDPLSEVLQVVAQSLQIKMTRVKRQVQFSPQDNE